MSWDLYCTARTAISSPVDALVLAFFHLLFFLALLFPQSLPLHSSLSAVSLSVSLFPFVTLAPKLTIGSAWFSLLPDLVSRPPRGGIADSPARFFSRLEIPITHELDEVWDNVGVQHSLGNDGETSEAEGEKAHR